MDTHGDSPTLHQRAAHLIRVRGWHQGGYLSSDGALCVMGAINMICHGSEASPHYGLPCDGVCDALRNAVVPVAKPTGTIAGWNDSRERTAADVLHTLDAIV